MASPFAKLEQRMNAVAICKFANAVALFGDGSEVSGVFDEGYMTAPLGAGIATSSPTFQASPEELPAGAVDMPVTIRNALYRVVNERPDANGLTILELEKA